MVSYWNTAKGLFLAAGTAVALLASPIVAQDQKPAAPKVKPADRRAAEKAIQAHNAARIDNGGRIALELLGEKTGKDKVTMPEACVDGNPRTRCVTWGTPIQYRIDLVGKLPITQVNFICEDSAQSQSPKDIEVRLSDGTVIKHTLEVIRPSKETPMPRQAVEVNKEVEWVEVKILSLYEGQPNAAGKTTSYGGIGEIEVITSADLTPYLTVADYNAAAPAFIDGGSPRNDYSAVKVAMPTAIPMGEHPGIYLNRDEIVKLREEMKSDPRGVEMMARLMAFSDAALEKPVEFPDPKIPAQVKDRGDAPAKAHGALARQAGWLGWAYQLSDNPKYAEKAREILVGYAKLYPNDYQEHKGVNTSDTSKVMAQRLSEAMWILPLIQSYDLIYNAPCMTEADRKLIDQDLIGACITFINGKRSAADEVAGRARKNAGWKTADPGTERKVVGNWTNFYNAAYIQGGVCLGDQNWIDIGMDNTRTNLARGIGNDGMWGEGAIGYHLFGRHALVACMEALARKGIDLYGFDTCRFKNLFDSPLKYAYPDGTAPGIGDSGRASVAGSWEAMAFDFAYLRYQDPNYGGFVNSTMRQVMQSEGCYFPTVIYQKLPEQQLEGLSSLIFDSLGYAILRGEDAGGKTYLLMDYGPHGGGHGHPDKLNLILYADGDELAGEPQGYRYEDRRHAEWTRPTVAHWTLSVDQHAQAPCTGKLLAFSDGGSMKVMRGTSDQAYSGVALDRTAVQMPGYFVDVYRAWGPASHTMDYPLCFRGSLDALKGVDPATLKPMGSALGYKHLATTPAVETSSTWAGVWKRDAVTVTKDQEFAEEVPMDDRRSHPANEVKVLVVGEPGTTVFTGTVPGGRHEAVLRRQSQDTVFAAIVDPYRAGDAVKSAEKFAVEGPVPAYGLKVARTDGGTDLVIVRYDQQKDGKPAAASTGQGVATDALVTVVRLDAGGKVIGLGMIGGTTVKVADQALTLDAPGVKWMN